MRIGIAANPSKPEAIRIAERVLDGLRGRADVSVTNELPELGRGETHAPLDQLGPDAVVAIGGDGTFLFTLGRSNAPLLPINAGTVGVLAEVDGRNPRAVDEAIARLLGGRYFLEGRMKLAGLLGSRALPEVVNEFVVHSTPVGKMGLFELAVDGQLAGRIQADGVIVSSPTGSTGYSLSSQGPVIDPALDALVLTTLAPFRLEPRSVVLDPLHTVRLTSIEEGRHAVVIADGQDEFPLPDGASVTIYKSPRRATLIRFGSRFYQRLSGKRILPWSDEPGEGDGRADVPPPA